MRIIKRHPLLKPLTHYVIDAPQPSNISYWWNVGSLLGLSLTIQIVTGITLAMHYNPSVLEAFNSVEHIMRDVNNGWLIRYLHSNTASAFFFLVYLHIGRGLYYGSYKGPRTLVWTIGTTILILMMATAFLGYPHSLKWSKYEKKTYYNSSNINNISGKRFYSTLNSNDSQISKVVQNFICDKNLKPVFIYEDLTDQNIKNKIKDDSISLSGIYLVLNKVTLDFYIGSASTDKFYSRFYRHLINLTGSKIIKLAIRKFSLNNFAFIILELYPEVINVENNKKLLDLEDFYLKSLLPNYNILTEAGSSFGYKHTDIDRIKMSDNYSDERRLKIGSLNVKKTLSKETIEEIKKSALKRLPGNFSEKALKMKKKSNGIVLYNINSNTVFGEYNSITDAAFNLNCNVKTIIRSLKTEKKILLKRWVIQYK